MVNDIINELNKSLPELKTVKDKGIVFNIIKYTLLICMLFNIIIFVKV